MFQTQLNNNLKKNCNIFLKSTI